VTPGARRTGWRDGIAAALVVTFARPASWAIGLAGFLAGGGLVLMAWPVLVLPTPSGLQNTLGGPVSSLAFGSPSPALILLLVALVTAGVVLLLAGIGVGAWAERAGIESAVEAARDEGLGGLAAVDLAGAPGATAVAVLRVVSLVPVGVALALAWPPLYAATYRELLVPGDLAVPVAVRVITDIPGVIAGVVVTWLVADAAAALAVRHLVLDRRRTIVALLLGWVDLLRRPHRVLATALLGLLPPAAPVALALAGAAVGWSRAREALVSGGDGAAMLAAVLLWVAAWLAALVLAGAGSAFRSAAFTFEGRHGAVAGAV
jgi:hypothetical protein